MADEALPASVAEDAGKSVARAQDGPAPAAWSRRFVRWAERVSAAAPCRQVAAPFAEQSCVAAEALAPPALPARPLRVAAVEHSESLVVQLEE